LSTAISSCVLWKATNILTESANTSPPVKHISLAGKEILRISRNAKVQYLFHKSPPTVPNLSHINPVLAFLFCYSKIQFSTIFPSTLDLPSCLFPSGFPRPKPRMQLLFYTWVLHALPISLSIIDHLNDV
jgi:hypothetical protein